MAPYDPEVTTTCRWRFQLRDGNVFTPVCHSVQGGVSVQEGSLSRSLCPGGLCPGGSLSSGVSVQGGLYPLGSLVQGVSVMTQCRLAQRINRNGLGFLLFPCKIYHNGLEIGVNQFFFHNSRGLFTWDDNNDDMTKTSFSPELGCLDTNESRQMERCR